MSIFLIDVDYEAKKVLMRRTMQWLNWCKELDISVVSKRAAKLRKLLYNQYYGFRSK